MKLTQIGIILSIFLLCSCAEKKTEDLLLGKWQQVKFFMNEQDLTRECHLDNVGTVTKDSITFTSSKDINCNDGTEILGTVKYALSADGKQMIIGNLVVNIDLLTDTELELSAEINKFVNRQAYRKIE